MCFTSMTVKIKTNLLFTQASTALWKCKNRNDRIRWPKAYTGISWFSCCDNILWQKGRMEGRPYLDSQFHGTATMLGESWEKELEAAGHMVSKVTWYPRSHGLHSQKPEDEECWWQLSFSFQYTPGPTPGEWCNSPFKWDFLPLLTDAR